ncbi:MAG: hypothetical protein JSS49_28805 [Planctomycetes bacterium]|nr:hypothetical protein [Planctomycetota bacterium]
MTPARWVLACLVMSTALHPISTDDFWWQLSRGRAVLNGAMSPSASRLAGDRLAEADWLGGVPFAVAYQFMGLWALMLLKFAVVVLIANWCWRQTKPLSPAVRQLSTIAMILVATVCSDPSPVVWDILGLILAFALAQRLDASGLRWKNCLQLGLLACAWANLAPGCLLVLWPLALTASRQRESTADSQSRDRSHGLWWGLACAIAGLCLTPRGAFTITDSLRQLVPLVVATPTILNQTPWRPLWLGPIDALTIGWLILSLLAIGSIVRTRRIRSGDWLPLVLVISLGTWFRPNTAVMSVCLVQWLANPAIRTPPAIHAQPLKIVQWGIAGLFVLFATASCLGVSPLFETRAGWGLGRRLEYRLFAKSVLPAISPRTSAGEKPIESAHCMDVSSAGMLAWLGAGHPRPYLVPQRALVNGQLRSEVLLNEELQSGWLKQHRRSDGTDGGWWLTLRSRNTGMLVTSADNGRLIKSLQPTIWKPLSIDTPVIPFALAGDPRFQPRIVDVAAQLNFVDRGAWTFQPEPAAGNDQVVDIIGWLTGSPDPDSILRQSSVLRAMNQPLAAARVLHPLLPIHLLSGRGSHELAACQLELAHREFLTCGVVGEFRTQVLTRLGSASSPQAFRVANPNPPPEPESIPPKAIDLYLSGHPQAAADELPQTAAELSARAMLEWEAGRLDEVTETWAKLLQLFPDSRYSLSGRLALDAASY